MTAKINFASSQRLSIEFSETMFGANILFDRDAFGSGTFDEAISYLNLSGLRYPGGAVSEQYFDLGNPDATATTNPNTGNAVSLLPLSEFIREVGRLEVAPTIVIPTRDLLVDGVLGSRDADVHALDRVRTFVWEVLSGSYGRVDVHGFEIGNEYWGSGQMTAAEYGKIVNLVAPMIQTELDEYSANMVTGIAKPSPKIIIQAGQFGKYSTSPGHIQNNDIMNELSPAAASAIDVVTKHFYSTGPFTAVQDYRWFFDRLNSWPSDPRFSHVETWVTEWNTNHVTSDQTGLKQSGAMLAMFVEMLRGGVTSSFVWPVQQNTPNDLFGDEGELQATFGGEMFKMLSSMGNDPSLEFANSNDLAKSYVFSAEGQTIIFLENSSDKVLQAQIDLDFMQASTEFMWSQKLGSVGGADDPHAGVRVELEQKDVSLPKDHSVSLDPFELVKIVYVKSGYGAKIEGQQFVSSNQGTTSLDDTILGSLRDDTLLGHIGDDELNGRSGQDVLFGGTGNDTLYGDRGQDLLVSGIGVDLLKGGSGADILISTSLAVDEKHSLDLIESLIGGNYSVSNSYLAFERQYYPGICLAKSKAATTPNQLNMSSHVQHSYSTIYGDDGSDLILLDDLSASVYGGVGDDRVRLGTGDDDAFGGAGNDVFVLNQGIDFISGGGGADEFIFDTALSNSETTVSDFDTSFDQFIVFDSLTKGVETFSLWASPTDNLGQDFVWVDSDLIYNTPNGGSVTFLDLLE